MTITQRDLQLYAARVRPHFAPELRDMAEALAYQIAGVVGPNATQLRPETTLEEILEWLEASAPYREDSIDEVEWIMALEEETGFEIPDRLTADAKAATFKQWVECAAKVSKNV